MAIISHSASCCFENFQDGEISTGYVEKRLFPGAPIPGDPPFYLFFGTAVSVLQKNMEGDHRFVEMSLKRGVAPFRQPAVTKIAFQTFYHTFHGGSLSHHSLKSSGCRRIPGINVRKQVKRDCDRPSAFRIRTAFRPVSATQANRCAVPVAGSLIYESAGSVPHSLILRLMLRPACQGSTGSKAFHAPWEPPCHRGDPPGVERSHENYAEIFQEIVLQSLIGACAAVKGGVEPGPDFREILKKSLCMGKECPS